MPYTVYHIFGTSTLRVNQRANGGQWNGKQVAEALHIPASAVSRSLALLDLPPDVQQRVSSGELAARSAYELSKLPDARSQKAIADQVVGGKLTYQQTARAVQTKRGRARPKRKPGGAKVEFWAEKGCKITVSSKSKGNYHHVKEALVQALEETDLRIKANIQMI